MTVPFNQGRGPGHIMVPDMGHGELQRAVALGAAVPKVQVFDVQSFLDTTLLASAIILPTTPPPGQSSPVALPNVGAGGPSTNGIAANTELPTQQLTGVGFALLPASETPVAVLPTFKGGGSHGTAVFLKPGQVYYPGKEFSAFKWGLPYGWLGGGVAYLVVLREFVGYSFWTGNKELVYHRVTMPIQQNTYNSGTSYLQPNYPQRFPWPNAVAVDPATSKKYPLPGQPSVSVTPTRTVVRLRTPLGLLATPGTVRLNFFNTNDFGLDGTVNPTFIDTYWPAFTESGMQIKNVATVEWPMQTLSADQVRIGGDSCVVIPVTPDNSIPAGLFLDFVRYGTL